MAIAGPTGMTPDQYLERLIVYAKNIDSERRAIDNLRDAIFKFPSMIDWDALADVEDGNYGWRSAFPELSARYVAGQGDNPLAMIIGEAPGAQEDVELTPFVGASGRVLRQLMALAGLYATAQWSSESEKYPETTGEVPPNCWLTNTVKFRPPGNRKPTPLEIKAARPWLRREWIAVGSPRVIVTVGGTALHAVLGKPRSVIPISGAEITCISRTDGLPLHIWPMLHPAFGLRNNAVQPTIEKDWERFSEWMREYPF